jgi:glutathione synthase/RimK-type ligase-like ATP-grasp enzyme
MGVAQTHLVITREDDPHADLVVRALATIGDECIRLNPTAFPRNISLTISIDCEAVRHRLLCGRRHASLSAVRTVWWRQPDAPSVRGRTQRDAREVYCALDSLWLLLADRFWVNPYPSYQAARCKPYQLHVAREVGFDVPPTLVTNEPAEALRFFEACGGDVIFKTFEVCQRFGDGRRIYTSRVTAKDLEDRSAEITLSPCQFQQHIAKQTELRVTVIGDEIFAAEISTGTGEPLPLDWRRRPAEIVCRAFDLPRSLASMVRNLVGRLGLVFGCIDFVQAADGRLLFLEINPSGQWYWIEQRTGQPLLEAMVRLISGRSSFKGGMPV